MKFLKQNKKRIIFIISILLFLVFIFTSLDDENGELYSFTGTILTPIQSEIAELSSNFENHKQENSSYEELEEENATLEEENEQLEQEIYRLQQIEQDYYDIMQLHEFSMKYPEYTMVGGRVIAKDYSNWYKSFVIDVGYEDQVNDNYAVVCEQGLIGKTSNTKNNQTTVTTILDEGSSVSGACVRTGDTGVVKGDIEYMKEGYCKMEYIDIDSTIMEGDEIVTSGYSDIYPPGISIGTVVEVGTDVNGLTKYAIIEPSVDFSDINNVMVITDYDNYSTTVEE